MMYNEVHVLFEGYSHPDPTDDKYMRANCSCTLIKGKNGYNVIVDTMTPWDKNAIVEALQTHQLTPADIQAVVCTHGHSDHTGNNNIFPNIEWLIVGNSISSKDRYLNHNFSEQRFALTDDISVITTPGHTLECVSVIVESVDMGMIGNVGIVGDLFEKFEDIEDESIWIEAGSQNVDLQRQNRLQIGNLVNHIVPGHGKMFEVNQAIVDKLQESFK